MAFSVRRFPIVAAALLALTVPVAARAQHALDVDPGAAHLAHEVRDLRRGGDHRHVATGRGVVAAANRDGGTDDQQ